ncbi:hypothetical protein ACFFP0_24585 [Rhizobium puerariae]|uniref:Uncharacterized protein n=1 Tax=Rhizobium puerariae TaxID=1585791 RepID=A0ABV6AN39_9HYPH
MLLNIRTGEVPELIKKTAQEIAGAFYDMNRTERFRQYAGTQDAFVKVAWKDHVQTAVDLLAQLLAMPGTADYEREAIYDALTEFSERSTERTPSLSTRRLR